MEKQDSWKDKYADAMLELDRANLRTKIGVAQVAIQRAIQSQGSVKGPGRAAELQALADALHNLRTLHRVEFSKGSDATGGMSLQASEATS